MKILAWLKKLIPQYGAKEVSPDYMKQQLKEMKERITLSMKRRKK